MKAVPPIRDPQRLLLTAAGAILFLSMGYTEMAGSDLWWHIAAGRELMQTASPWMIDQWSFPAGGGDWLNHEWLADIIFYAWTLAFGLTSLVYWKWLVVVATFGLLQWVLWRQSGNGLAAFLAAAIAAYVAAPFIDMRPHLYTLLLFSLLLVMALERQPRRLLLALLFLVWVNLHGGFFFGLMALAVLIFPWRDLSPTTFRAALITGLLCVMVATINPSGFKTFLYPLIYAFDDSSPYRELAEWRSPFEAGGIRSPTFFVLMWTPLLALLYFIPAVRRSTGIPFEAVLLTTLTLAMALTSRRFIPIFGMSLALLLAPLLALALSQIRTRALQLGFAAALLGVAVMRMLPYPLQAQPAFHYLTAEYTYPEDMLDFVERNRLRGDVYALYNWGGYMHLRTDGGLRVFIDGRADTVYDGATYLQYKAVASTSSGWIDLVEQTGAEFFLWSHYRRDGARKRREMLASGRWQLLYEDAVSWLAVRDGVVLPEALTLPGPSAMRNLTLGTQAARRGEFDQVLQRVREVRREIPWQQRACQLEIDALRRANDEVGAARVMRDCLGYFPTAFLR